jgi:type I restriction enzyme, S subunit
MFKSHVFRRYVDGLNTGSLIQHMFVSQIAEFTFPLPPLHEQRVIAEKIEQRLSVLKRVEVTIEACFKRTVHLRQSILKRAFEGKLVPQDPTDEPASELPARIKAERERSGYAKRRKKNPAREEPAEAQAGLF